MPVQPEGNEPEDVVELGRKDAGPQRQAHIDHGQIRAMIADLNGCKDLGELFPKLESLEAVLVEHFRDEEEDGGLYEDLVRLRPHLHGRIQRFSDEHKQLLTMISELCSAISALLEGQGRIINQINDFSQKLSNHEEAETKIMLDAYLVDEGGSG